MTSSQEQWAVERRTRTAGLFGGPPGPWSDWRIVPRTSGAPYLRRQDAQTRATVLRTEPASMYSSYEAETRVARRVATFTDWEVCE